MTTAVQAPAPTSIVFGTDGWRARVAEDYTFHNVRRCADAVAEYVAGRGEQAKGVVIAYDRRFASEHFAEAAAEVLVARDIPVAISVHAVPTQMSSYEVVERGAAAGVVITASHNPWTDNGFKVKSPSGSAAGPEILKALEARIAANGGQAIDRRPMADAEAAGLVERFDPYDGYERYVRRTVDVDELRGSDIRVLVEPMWGSRSGRTSTRRSASWPAAATTWACCWTATPTGRVPPTSRGTSFTSWRSPACSPTTWPSIAGSASRS